VDWEKLTFQEVSFRSSNFSLISAVSVSLSSNFRAVAFSSACFGFLAPTSTAVMPGRLSVQFITSWASVALCAWAIGRISFKNAFTRLRFSPLNRGLLAR
jgi:hypothetical protein